MPTFVSEVLLTYYPHMPIGMLGYIGYCLFVCPQDFGNGYLGRELA